MTGRVKVVVGALVALAFCGSVPTVTLGATVASDAPAGLIVAPKVLFNSADLTYGLVTETTVQLTNTSATETRAVHCFYVDATRRCDIDGSPCHRNSDCPTGDFCAVPDWTAHNFTVELSPNQTLGWNLSAGINVPGPGSGAVPPAPGDPFLGELKCLEVSDSTPAALPLNANDLIATVTILQTGSGPAFVDAESYNAIGIPANAANGSVQNDLILCLGGTPGSTECPVPAVGQSSEYAACPRSLWMNHYFDTSATFGAEGLSTSLTLVPCSENFVDPTAQQSTTVQFLIYNEFEQRFSARSSVDCYVETPLVLVDSKVNGRNSVFSLGVQGTVGGQTLIRPVTGSESAYGHGILGIGEQVFVGPGGPSQGTTSAAFNLNHAGVNPQGDVVRFVIP